MKNFSNHKGFTLLELLTVIGILSVIGTISVAIITVTFRGAKKTDLLETARQNGNTAMLEMVKNIRYAQSMTSPAACVPTTTTNSITIISLLDHNSTTYSCSNGTISSNSASLIDNRTLQVSSCSFVCSQVSSAVPPIITIQYVLAPKNANGFAESNFSLPFQTSVTLRNY